MQAEIKALRKEIEAIRTSTKEDIQKIKQQEMNQRKANSKLSDDIKEINEAITTATRHEKELRKLPQLFAAQSKLGRAHNSMINKLDDISNKHIKQAGRIHHLTTTKNGTTSST